MNSIPSISVVLPVLKPGRHLAVALASIRRQQVPPELIVVNSSAADEDSIRAAAPEARHLFQAPRGPAAARNAGLAVASGEWIAFLDADDEWSPDTLAVLAGALLREPAALFALGKTRFEPPTTEPWVAPNFGAGLYRREVFTRIGLLPEDRPVAEDIEWFLRVRETGIPYAVVDHVTLCYRRWPGGITAGRSWREFGLESVIRESLARRRQASGTARELPLLSGSKNDPRATGPVNHAHPRRQAD